MSGELLGQKLRLGHWGEGGNWGIWPGVRPAFNLKIASINQGAFTTTDFPDEATGTTFAYNGKPGFGGELEVTANIGKRWKESEALDKATKGLKDAHDEVGTAAEAVRAAELAIKALEEKIKAVGKEKEAELKVEQTKLATAKAELKVKEDELKKAVEKRGEAETKKKDAAKESGEAQFNLIVGARYAFDQTSWDLGSKPEGLKDSKVTERRHIGALVVGAQYRRLSVVAGFIVKGSSEFERNATADQTSGVLVTGAPIPSNQPHPVVYGVDDSVKLGGWDLSLRVLLPKLEGVVPVEVGFTMGQRKTGSLKDQVYSGGLSEDRQDFREERGVGAAEDSISISVDPPDDNFVTLSLGFPF